jgi:cell division transport system ATP-binding protein
MARRSDLPIEERNGGRPHGSPPPLLQLRVVAPPHLRLGIVPVRVAEPRPLVQVVGASHFFGKVPALSDLNLSLAAGEVAFVSGPSGAGKTTLLRLLHGQLWPRRGEVWVDGHPFHRRWLRGVAKVRRQTGFVFQDFRLLPRLTAFENVVFALEVADPLVPKRIVRRRAKEVLEAVGLGKRANAYPDQLSGGEKQRVAIARALAPRPALLLVDEPISALDNRRAEVVMRELLAAAEQGASVVITTHRPTGFERGHKQLRLTEPAESPKPAPRRSRSKVTT